MAIGPPDCPIPLYKCVQDKFPLYSILAKLIQCLANNFGAFLNIEATVDWTPLNQRIHILLSYFLLSALFGNMAQTPHANSVTKKGQARLSRMRYTVSSLTANRSIQLLRQCGIVNCLLLATEVLIWGQCADKESFYIPGRAWSANPNPDSWILLCPIFMIFPFNKPWKEKTVFRLILEKTEGQSTGLNTPGTPAKAACPCIRRAVCMRGTPHHPCDWRFFPDAHARLHSGQYPCNLTQPGY